MSNSSVPNSSSNTTTAVNATLFDSAYSTTSASVAPSTFLASYSSTEKIIILIASAASFIFIIALILWLLVPFLTWLFGWTKDACIAWIRARRKTPPVVRKEHEIEMDMEKLVGERSISERSQSVESMNEVAGEDHKRRDVEPCAVAGNDDDGNDEDEDVVERQGEPVRGEGRGGVMMRDHDDD